jgi:hypothetical protein
VVAGHGMVVRRGCRAGDGRRGVGGKGRHTPHLPSDTFSPESGGRTKVTRDKEAIKAQGMIKLKP